MGASTSCLAIAYAGCSRRVIHHMAPRNTLHVRKAPHSAPWLVFLSSKKTGAPSSLHTRASPARSSSHKRVMQGADIGNKTDHSY